MSCTCSIGRVVVRVVGEEGCTRHVALYAVSVDAWTCVLYHTGLISLPLQRHQHRDTAGGCVAAARRSGGHPHFGDGVVEQAPDWRRGCSWNGVHASRKPTRTCRRRHIALVQSSLLFVCVVLCVSVRVVSAA